MKLDGLGVILAIILLPIILITTYYIQLQVDTIATENQYNTKLLDATYDAMSAFEMNTANEELSSVADSMRSLVLASNNIFLNTLATNFGISNASKEYLQPYIPAVLYTMYDGFYIYSPTQTAKVAEKKDEETTADGDKITTTKGYLSVGDERTESLGGIYGDVVYEKDDGGYTIKKDEAKKETDYILKSYIQYSARYQNDEKTKDVTINYTLDNYLNIVGKIDNVYYTKTGYLIKNNLVTEAKINNNVYDLETHNEDDAKNAILGLKTNAEETTIKAANSASVIVNGILIESDFKNVKNTIYQATGGNTNGGITISTMSEAETYLEKFYETYESNPSANAALLTDIQNLEYEIGKCKAVAYYVSSACFSNWVYENLAGLKYNNIVDTAMTEYYQDEEGNPKYTSSTGVDDLYYSFTNNETAIFNQNQDPEDTESNFNTHRMEIIKNSIKYNLNLAMSAYMKMEHPYDCSLPVLTDEEWDKILSNISIVSFMQGWDCGLKIYNNYQIVSSTNNELTVTPDEIYYVKKDEFNNKSGNYHRIDCPYLQEAGDYISFKSKEVKYDKIYDKSTGQYQYDHKNLACYTCINTSGYDSEFKQKTDKEYYKDGKKYTAYYDRIGSLENENKKRAGYIGLAKERQDIYKTNTLPVSEGYEIVQRDEKLSTSEGVTINGFNLLANKIKKLQITISDTKEANALPSGTAKEPILQLNITAGGKTFSNQAINLNQKKEQTITLDVSDVTSEINEIKFLKGNMPNYDVSYKVKSIKAIYK